MSFLPRKQVKLTQFCVEYSKHPGRGEGWETKPTPHNTSEHQKWGYKHKNTQKYTVVNSTRRDDGFMPPTSAISQPF